MINWKMKIFKIKLEKIQYKACNAIIGAIQRTSRQKFDMNHVYVHYSKEGGVVS